MNKNVVQLQIYNVKTRQPAMLGTYITSQLATGALT